MIHWLFWPAVALTLPQALWIKQTAVRFTDADGPAQGTLEGQEPLRLCGIGDSIISGVGCLTLNRALIGCTARALSARYERGVHWQAIGRTGATTGGIAKHLLPKLPKTEVDVFLVSAGVNDITALKRLPSWSTALKALIQSLHDHSPDARIVLLGIPPIHCFPLLPQPLRSVFGCRARSFDQAAMALVQSLDHAVYVPFEGDFPQEKFAPDGYHPSENACIELAEEVVLRLASDHSMAFMAPQVRESGPAPDPHGASDRPQASSALHELQVRRG